MNIPTNFKFTESNEWIKVEGNQAWIGISDFAQSQLSDIVFAEIVAAIGDTLTAGNSIATIESVKAAADVYTPVSGEVVEINEDLAAAPEVINSDPYGAAWMVKIKLFSPAEVEKLMDAAAYEKFIQEQE